MFGEFAPKLKGVNNNFAFSLTGTANEITVSGAWPSYVLSFPNVLHSVNNILDDGGGGFSFATSGSNPANIGTSTYSGNLSLGNSSSTTTALGTVNIGTSGNRTISIGNTTGPTLQVIQGVTTFQAPSGTSPTVAIVGLSSSSSDQGTLRFQKSGSTPTGNGDALGELSSWGVNSGGTSTRSARMIWSAIANATASGVESQLAFRHTTASGSENIPLIINENGCTITALNISGLTPSRAVVTDGSNNLTSLAYGASNVANTLVERDSSGNFSAGTITASLTGHASLDLALTGGTMSGFLILNADPTTGLGACTKQYADAISAGLTIKAACYAMTTGNLSGYTYNNGASGVGATLTAGSTGVFTTDGTTPALNSRILVANQTSTFQNGIYTVTTSSGGSNAVLTRATDYDQSTEIHPGDLIIVDNGTTGSGTGWIQTAVVTTIGTDPITFSNFGLTNAGTGLTRTGNTISLINPVAANLGGTGLGPPSPGYMLTGSGTPGNWAFIPAPSAEQILGTDVTGGIFWLSTLPTLVQTNITATGTIGTGIWQGTVINPTYGGTGVNNGSRTITLGGNINTANSFTTSGNFAVTQTYTGSTNVTFPTSGTLATTAQVLTSTWQDAYSNANYGGL